MVTIFSWKFAFYCFFFQVSPGKMELPKEKQTWLIQQENHLFIGNVQLLS